MQTTTRFTTSRRAAIGLASIAAAFSLTLTGCQIVGPNPVPTDDATEQHQEAVTIVDSWVKATDPEVAPGEAMTGLFGTLQNHTDEDLTIESVESDDADLVELHEVVDGKMRAIEGDVTIPAGGEFVLEPGANHIMLMELKHALTPGDDITVKVNFTDGTSFDIVALVKDTAGANESYEDLDGHDMGDHDMMDHDDK